jgi:parallel beta-helix repeat protein
MRGFAKLSALALLVAGASVRANDYWVSAVAGDNVTGDGSLAYPWQTVTHAFNQGLLAGDVVHVYCGLYNAALGESFPILIPAGVTLKGEEGAHVTILDAGNASDVVRLASDVTLSGFTVRNSSHAWWDAGVAHWSPGANLVVENCILRGNERGLHLWNGNTNVLVRNCVFANNANDAISCFGSTGVTLLNCSFRGNLKGMIFDGSVATVRNTIVTNSGIAGIQNSMANPSTLTLDHNDVFGNAVNYDPPTLVPGAGAISADPKWVNGGQSDLHVWPTSPCVNAGVADPLLSAVDLDGDPRVVGAAVDIGADERGWPDVVLAGLPQIGGTGVFDIFGNPSSPWALFAAAIPSTGGIATPWGTLYLDLNTLTHVAGAVLNAEGGAFLTIPVPNIPSIIGATVYFQEFGLGASGFALSPLRAVPIH